MPVNSFENYPMSWKPEKKRLQRPFYLSIAEALIHDIAMGILLPNTKLPPQRELADFLDLNFTTITRAYRTCELKGALYTVRGSGTFVSPNAAKHVTISANQYTGNSIDLAFVASFEECNAMIADKLPQLLKSKHIPQLLDYNEPTGMRHQKAVGIEWMKSLGVEAVPEQTAIVSGAQNALLISLLAAFEPGSRIAVDLYTYPNFIELSKMLHLPLVAIANDAYGMSAEDLERQCGLQNIKGVFLMPSCANPTAIVIPDVRRQELTKIIKQHNLIVMEDDSYAFLLEAKEHYKNPPFFARAPENTIYICGTSKSICSGLRVAYMTFPGKLQEKIQQAIFNVNVKTSSLSAEIISQLILSGEAEKIIAQKKALAQKANVLFDQYFGVAAENQNKLSFFRWLPIKNSKSFAEIEQELLNRGVQVFASNRFLSSKSNADQYFRVALSTANSFAKLDKGLQILSGFLAEYKLNV